VISFPNAKINIGLHVVAKRSDGFHDIETVMVPVPVSDILEVMIADDGRFSFTESGIAVSGAAGNNLCVRAWRMLRDHYGAAAVKIHLHKQIPMGAGLGGGSADGAFTLKMVNDLLKMGIDLASLEDAALQMGSDIPFFIRNVPAVATGRGEKLVPVPLSLKGMWLLLVMPSFHVPTAKAYQWVRPDPSREPLAELITKPVARWRDALENDFEKEVFARHPEGFQVKRSLYDHGAVYAQMTGSGSAIFGLFEEPPAPILFPGARILFRGLL